MSKNNTETKQPAYVEELLKNGTATLRAKTREELDMMVQQIPADTRIAAGVVARNRESGDYVLRVDIIK
jgi:hypothetical protein